MTHFNMVGSTSLPIQSGAGLAGGTLWLLLLADLARGLDPATLEESWGGLTQRA